MTPFYDGDVQPDDGPETAGGSYLFGDRTYRLVATGLDSWQIFDGPTLLGEVLRTRPESGSLWPEYAARSVDEDTPDLPATDDWRAAVEHLIDVASL